MKYFSKVERIQEDAKELIKERDARGEGSMYAYMQNEVRPEVSDLVENKERLDVLCGMNVMLDGKETKVLRWLQGEVKHAIEGRPFPAVMVEWNKMEDIVGWEKGGEAEQILKNHLYNKHKKRRERETCRCVCVCLVLHSSGLLGSPFAEIGIRKSRPPGSPEGPRRYLPVR